MAGEEEVDEDVEASGGKKKLIIIIVAVVLLLIGGAVAGALIFMGGDDSEEVTTEAEEAMMKKSDPTYVDLEPSFTVNLHPDDSVGFLQVSIQVLTYSDEVVADIEKHKPLIRNNLVTLFGQQKSSDLRAPQGKEKLQKEVLGTIQKIIDKSGSGGEVDNVFFTSFVMQ